jgi:hypothetical protein
MQLQAGTVIGGRQLVSSPKTPRFINSRKWGSDSIQRSKTRDGSKQSNPITATFSTFLTRDSPTFLHQSIVARKREAGNGTAWRVRDSICPTTFRKLENSRFERAQKARGTSASRASAARENEFLAESASSSSSPNVF